MTCSTGGRAVQWGSATEFFAMGGYGLYVWSSYVVCALLMLSEPLLVRRRQRTALAESAAAADAAERTHASEH